LCVELGTRQDGDEHEGLDWFGPPESETQRPVWGGIMRRREVPSNGALGCLALYGQQTRASIRGRWTLIRVGYKMVRPSALITWSIPRSADLQAASGQSLVARIALQGLQILQDLDKVF
jgi:hypothetical protein